MTERLGADLRDAAHKHAVTAVGANAYTYDANGNMLKRAEWSGAWVQEWDADNRAVAMTDTTTGQRVQFVHGGRWASQILPDHIKIAYAGGIGVGITDTTRITETYYSVAT